MDCFLIVFYNCQCVSYVSAHKKVHNYVHDVDIASAKPFTFVSLLMAAV